MSCGRCEVKVEGRFSETLFNRLSTEDQAFLEQYLLAGFSIKTLEQRVPLGYAAIRSRLDRMIGHYRTLSERDEQKKAVIEELGAGQISVEQAKNRLAELSGG